MTQFAWFCGLPWSSLEPSCSFSCALARLKHPNDAATCEAVPLIGCHQPWAVPWFGLGPLFATHGHHPRGPRPHHGTSRSGTEAETAEAPTPRDHPYTNLLISEGLIIFIDSFWNTGARMSILQKASSRRDENRFMCWVIYIPIEFGARLSAQRSLAALQNANEF